MITDLTNPLRYDAWLIVVVLFGLAVTLVRELQEWISRGDSPPRDRRWRPPT
jgi:hypothetical protein